MELPDTFRESLVETLDIFLEAFATSPDSEAVAAFLMEQLETFADDAGIDDLCTALEESGEVDGTLKEALEAELESNDELEYTGEEIVSLLERTCGIEWSDDVQYGDDDDDDFTEEEEPA